MVLLGVSGGLVSVNNLIDEVEDGEGLLSTVLGNGVEEVYSGNIRRSDILVEV
jgi:hypothetical protein